MRQILPLVFIIVLFLISSARLLSCDVCHGFSGVGGQNPGWYNAGYVGMRYGMLDFQSKEADYNPVNRSAGLDFAVKMGRKFRWAHMVNIAETVQNDRAIGYSSSLTYFFTPMETGKSRTQFSLTGRLNAPSLSNERMERLLGFWTYGFGGNMVHIQDRHLTLGNIEYQSSMYKNDARAGDYGTAALVHYRQLRKNPDDFQIMAGLGVLGEWFGRNVRNGYLLTNTGGIMIRPSINCGLVKKKTSLMIDYGLPAYVKLKAFDYSMNKSITLRLMYRLG